MLIALQHVPWSLWDSDYICRYKRQQPHPARRGPLRAAGVLTLTALIAGAAGCRGAGAMPFARQTVSSGASVAIAPPVHHARVPREYRTRLISLCRLCDEYDLMEITSEPEWRAFVAAAGLTLSDYEFDFDAGHVVGVIAYVGTPMTPRWPIDISAVGRRGAEGWVMARLQPNLYHAVSVPGYCTFTYVAGVTHIGRVDVDPRSFALQY